MADTCINLDTITIIKNSGDREPFRPEKIHQHVKKACEGLAVLHSSIIMDARLKIFDGVRSVDIQNTLIQAAAEKISEQTPDYEIAAGRLLNQKIRKEVYGRYEPRDFFDEVMRRIDRGYYSRKLLSYSDDEIKEFGALIDYDRDNETPYSALSQLYSKYLIRHDRRIIEVPQEIYMLIPMAIFADMEDTARRNELVRTGYELLSTRKISLPTPIMNGARTDYRRYISCNLINAGDSTLSLSRAVGKIMECTAAKSGIGLNASHIRGLGADIGKPARMQHSGILPLMKTFEAAVGSLCQISRSGSANVTMPFFHYEIELFSQLGDSRGSLENRTRHVDQTIILNRWFIDKALHREDIWLFHMNEVPGLYEALGYRERFAELYERYAASVSPEHKKQVNAWELLNLFIFERSITGRVYFTFADNFVNSSFKEPLYFTNLCTEISLPARALDGSEGRPEIGCCILGNMNLGYTEPHEIPKVAHFLVNFLEQLIDASDYSIPEVEYAARNRRTLGIGISNLFGYLAREHLAYNSEEARRHVHEIMESFYYHLLRASNELAIEKGPCPLFNETIYADGMVVFDRYRPNRWNDFPLRCDWESLRASIKRHGLRHSTLCAIPPASNSSKPSNSTAGVEPPRELVTIKADKSSTIKQLVPYYKTSRDYYTTAWSDTFNNIEYFRLISCIQKFVDQSISLNQYSNALRSPDRQLHLGDVLREIIECFNLGIKTLYYQNFLSTENADGLREEGCAGGACTV